MSRALISIARLSLRYLIRSKIVATLLIGIALLNIGLPRLLHSDGTAQGELALLLNYTLGTSALFLSIASVWSGCILFSSEIQEKQAQLLFTKPVHPATIWLGKWLALITLNGAMLTLVGGAVFHQTRVFNNEVCRSQEIIYPTDPVSQILPGETVAFQFDLPAHAEPAYYFRYRAISARLGHYIQGTLDGSNVMHQLNHPSGSTQRFACYDPVVPFKNTSPNTILFDPATPPQLLVAHGSFSANYLRCLFRIFAQLCFMSALGISLGTFFSQPVALFSASWILILIACYPFISQLSQEMDETTMQRLYFGGLNQLAKLFQADAQLNQLATGIRIPTAQTVGFVTMKIGGGSAVLMALSLGALRKKELGR